MAWHGSSCRGGGFRSPADAQERRDRRSVGDIAAESHEDGPVVDIGQRMDLVSNTGHDFYEAPFRKP
jgi:hypothetical protein